LLLHNVQTHSTNNKLQQAYRISSVSTVFGCVLEDRGTVQFPTTQGFSGSPGDLWSSPNLSFWYCEIFPLRKSAKARSWPLTVKVALYLNFSIRLYGVVLI